MNRLVEELIADRRLEITREAMARGMAEGMREGRKEGIKEGIREGKQEGIREGKQEGIREGMRQGIVEGRRQEAASLTIRLLTRKLGELGAGTHDRVRQLSLEDLEVLGEKLLDFSDCSDLEKWLDKAREAH